MEFISPELDQYVCGHSENEPEVLRELNRKTHLSVLQPRMLSGHLQGLFLQFISNMIKPLNVLEIGTYTGYSAICLCSGIRTNGKLITMDKNEELQERVESFFDKSDYKNIIDYRIGNALDIIPNLDLTFDLVFIDADKINNAKYYDLIFDKVNIGGFIIADNVLWSGKILNEKMDKDTLAIDAFNKKIKADSRVEKMILPLRDGLSLIRKIKVK
jgi:predicted O-methyltransferase YrrM